MNGRDEKTIKIKDRVIDKIKDKEDYIQSFYYDLSNEGKEARGIEAYINESVKFIDFVKKHPSDIVRSDIVTYMSSLMIDKNGELNGGTYRYRTWFALNKFYDSLLNNGYVSSNLMQSINRPKATDWREVKRCYLTSDELKAGLQNIENGVGSKRAKSQQKNWFERDACIYVILVNTGVRCDALCNINISDINFENHSLVVIDKRGKTHKYYLTENVENYIKKWMNKRDELILEYVSQGRKYVPTDALFISSHRTRITPSSVSRICEKYTNGIKDRKITPHKIRYSYGTNLYSMTKNIKLVQISLGHNDLNTTQRYVIDTGEEAKEAAKYTDGLLF